MSENIHLSSTSGESESAAKSGEQYPTEEELREFESVQNSLKIGGLYPIEDFAQDSEHPTEDEIKAMNDFNRIVPTIFDLSFEDYFGYPDPRKTSSDDQDDLRMPEDLG